MDLNEQISLMKALGVDLQKDAEYLEPVEATEIKFKIYARDHDGHGAALKAWTEKIADSDEEDWLLSGIASSTIKDLHGDTMLPSALIDMERSAKNNLTIFGNHEYHVPEDVYGSVLAASIVASGEVDEKTGAPLYDLNFEKIRVNKRNERAKNSWLAMSDGTKLGLSIGARIPEGGAIRNKKTGTLLIAHVDLLETSIVGIPANPRSWIDSATRAVKAYEVQTAKTASGIEVPVTVKVATVTEPTETTLGEDGVEEGKTPETIVSDDKAGEPADPSTNTDAPSQDAQLSQPENDGADAAPEVIAAANDLLDETANAQVPDEAKELLMSLRETLATVTAELIDVDEARKAAEQRVDELEAKRVEEHEEAKDIVTRALDLVNQVGKLPAGRIASFKHIQRTADQLSDDYESLGFVPEVANMLRQRNT
ncbi:MAG TPA: hypothetical protein VFX15_02885 [Actinomycetes bacterium]|nr:hypothetical protein [Actinomycetes bacterium]